MSTANRNNVEREKNERQILQGGSFDSQLEPIANYRAARPPQQSMYGTEQGQHIQHNQETCMVGSKIILIHKWATTSPQ